MNGESSSSAARSNRIVVVGGGVSGLSVAYFLRKHRPEVDVVVLEASERFGGNLRTERVEDCLFDVGADCFLRTRPWALELCRELGLEGELITPLTSGQGVYVAFEGALHRMPEGLSLGVPLRAAALLETELLSPWGKLRTMLEPCIPRRRDRSEETIREFAERRLGREMAERIAVPLLAGVVAGDPDRLSIEASFPQLVQFEREHGSLVRGMLASRGASWLSLLGDSKRPESPFVSLKKGMSRLVERLVEVLPDESLRTRMPVERIERTPSGYRVRLKEGNAIEAEGVIVALPPWSAAKVLDDEAAREEIGEVRYSSTSTVFFAFDAGGVERKLDASGFIVPQGEGEILASTWVSSKWPGRAPEGTVLVRAFIGGTRNPELLDREDEVLERLALSELERLMGPLGSPRWSRVYRYRQGNPQPDVGHGARLERFRARMQAFPRLHVIGAGYGGVGIPDCVRQARDTARVLLEDLGRRP